MTEVTKKLFFLILSGLFIINSKAEECKIDDFKFLYIKLQNELNYENKDSRYNKEKHQIELVKHDPREAYGGKIFEKSLAREYENSLKKVGAIFDNFKHASSEELGKSDTQLINFFHSIESNSPQSIETSQFNTILKQIQKKSYDLYKDKYPNFVINNSDIYLLKKLLIHASDKICGVELSELKKTHSNIEIEKTKQMPINRLVNFLSKPNQDFKIIDGPKAVSLAIEEQLDNLRNWMANQSTGCQDKIRNTIGNFNHVQDCNYKHFVDSILNNSTSDVESVLHFINANKSRTDVMAETELDLSKFAEVKKVAPLQKAAKKIINEKAEINNSNETDELCRKLTIKSKESVESWKCSYTKALYSELSKASFDDMFKISLNKSDLADLSCPKYNKMNREEKQRFFIVYMAAIAKSESDFQPTDHYLEKDGTNSLGMLAIDRTAANKATKAFGKITDQDLKNPEMNLKVGTYIMNNQLKSSKYKGRLLTGDQNSAYYWSVIHNDDKQRKVIRDLNSNRSSLPSACQH